MAKQAKSKSAAGKKSPAPQKNSIADQPVDKLSSSSSTAASAWKWPVVLAAIIITVAGGSIWYKAERTRDNTATSAVESKSTAMLESPVMTANTGAAAGYVGSAVCAECHKSITETFSHIAMGRSLYPPTVDNIIENYDRDNEFYHEPSGVYFRMSREGDKFYQTSFQKDPEGRAIHQNKVDVSYIVGSGNHSRSYIHREPDGKTYQLPVAWYSQEKRWAMNPGYDNAAQINFSRRITYDCIFCHAAYPDLKPGADQSNFGESSFLPEHLEAIDCERCHGPAQQHVSLAQKGAAKDAIRKAIVNTGNLSNELQLEVCMQCHLETTSGNLPHSVHALDKGIFGYRPGEPLEDYRYAFNHPAGTGHDDKFEIAGQAYRMRMSPCFIKSEGKMTCTTCHDAHRLPKDPITAAIQSCLECHNPQDCTERMELRLPVKDNCIQCHMPRRRTDDVVHVVMTDHYIQRRPPPAEKLLAPKSERNADYRGDIVAYYPEEIAPDKRDLYMGLAYISNSANLEKGLTLLDAALDQNLKSRFPAVYTRGVALKMLGRLADARTGLEEAVKIRPDHPQAWMALGDLYEQMQNYTRSIECYSKAVQLDGRLSRAQNGLGTSKMMSGDLEGAKKAFRTAITLDPFDDNAHLNLSNIFLKTGDYAAAEAEARAALVANPNRSAGWGHLAQSALAQNRFEQVLWPVLEAIRFDGSEMQNAEVLTLASRSLPAEQAIATLDKLTTRSPFAALTGKAYVELLRGNVANAADALQAAAQESTRTSMLAVATQAALESNRPALALLWASQLVTALPNRDESTVAYASALRANRQEEQAAEILQTALVRERSPRTLNALAWLKSTAATDAVRDGQDAERLYNEALQVMGKPNLFLLETQAAIAAENGKITEAAAIAQQALDMARQAKLVMEQRRIEQQLAAYTAGKAYRAAW